MIEPQLEPHATGDGAYTCWCGALTYEVCTECDEDVKLKRSRMCWKCGHSLYPGLVLCESPLDYDGPFGLVVVHNERSSAICRKSMSEQES